MIDLGPHETFIFFAYLGVALVTFGLIGMIAIDARRQKARLEALDAMGIRRGRANGKPKT